MAAKSELTPSQAALLSTLKFSGERSRDQLSGLRGATWASLQDRGLITARLDKHGAWRFAITDSGRVVLDATPYP